MNRLRTSRAAGHLSWLILLLVGLTTTRVSGNANFVDATFSNSNWSASKIVDTTAGAAATVSAFQNLSGGNPGAYREVDETCKTAGTMFVAHFLGGAIYSPTSQGPIASIAFACDFIEFNPPSTGAQVGFGLLLQQGGTNFIVFNTSGSTSWFTTNQPVLNAASFFNVDTASGRRGNAHPDFSAQGSDMAFGYVTVTTSSAGAITNQCGLDNYSVTVFTSQPPVVTRQPQDQTAFVGGGANLSLTVSGSSPLAFQWYFNDTNLLSGATSSSLRLTSITTNQAGSYHAVVSNPAGTMVSSNAVLTVVIPDTNQPPVLPVIPPQTVDELTLLMVTNTATIANSQATLSYALVGTPAGMAIDANGIIRWTPAQSQSPSTNVVKTIATSTDSQDPVNPTLSSTNQFTIIVREVNQPPVLREVPQQAAQALNLLTVANTATVSNIHSTLTYALVGAAEGMAIDSNGIIRWTPLQAQSPSTNTVTTVATSTNPKDLINPTLSVTNAFTVIVQELNSPPVFRVIPLQTVSELNLLTVTNTATEANSHGVLSYELVGAPQGMTIDVGGIIRWTPTQTQSPGTNRITTVATSSNALDSVNPTLSATNFFTVIVREVNQPPVLPVIAAQTVSELSLLTVTNTATDANIHAVLSYRLLGPPPGMTIDNNGIVIWTPSQAQGPSTNVITAIATSTDILDLVNPTLSATNSFTVIVLEVNLAPVFRPVPLQTVSELSLLTVTNTATTANANAVLSYKLVSAPAGMTIDAGGIIRWTPTHTQSPGTNLVATVATSTDVLDLVNPTVNATNSFLVVVREINRAPLLPVIPPQTVNELSLLTVTNTATAGNSRAVLSYRLQGAPAGMAIDASGIVRWTPAQTQSPSTNFITAIATGTDALDLVNPVLSATNQFTVFVQEVNVAPVPPEVPPQVVRELNLLTVTNTASAPNIHSTLSYALVGAPTGMTIDSLGIIRWTPAQAQSPSTNTITTIVTSTDTKDLVNPALSATNSFTVVVQEVNTAPVFRVISPQTVNELTLLTVTNAASVSNIHSLLSYTLVGAPEGMTIDASGIIRWVPIQTQSPGTSVITTVATSTDTLDLVNPTLSATNSFTVIVREINQPPILPAVPVQNAIELSFLTVTNTATAQNIHAVLSYALLSPPPGMIIDGSGIIRWTTPARAQSAGPTLVTTVATSTDSLDLVNPTLHATNTFTVFVKAKETNATPLFGVILPQAVNELALLTVANTAIESDSQATLAYRLVNPPAGMTIDGNGVIRWTPAQTQSPSTNLITTVVTSTDALDPLNPVLSATNAFTVIVQEVNAAPALPAIAQQRISELSLLTVSNTATTANIHALLSYTLVSPPVGMTIDGSGIIRWTPSHAQSPSTNVITTVATSTDAFDTVNPTLSATNVFTVIVTEAVVAPAITITPPAELNVQGVAGLTFALQVSTDLIQWTTVTNVTSSAASFHWTDPTPDADLRFYRALVAP